MNSVTALMTSHNTEATLTPLLLRNTRGCELIWRRRKPTVSRCRGSSRKVTGPVLVFQHYNVLSPRLTLNSVNQPCINSATCSALVLQQDFGLELAECCWNTQASISYDPIPSSRVRTLLPFDAVNNASILKAFLLQRRSNATGWQLQVRRRARAKQGGSTITAREICSGRSLPPIRG
jgi:hypothetical protein